MLVSDLTIFPPADEPGDQFDQAAQQEVREREEHGRSLLRVRNADPINALVEGTIRGLCALQAPGVSTAAALAAVKQAAKAYPGVTVLDRAGFKNARADP